MSHEQQSWSKSSSLNGPFKDRQLAGRRPQSVKHPLYGNITDLRGEESYSEEFSSGVQVKMVFDKPEMVNYSDKWYYLDVIPSKFYREFGPPTSAKLIIVTNRLRCVLEYTPPDPGNGRVKLIGDSRIPFEGGHTNDAFSLGNIFNGISDYEEDRFQVIKPVYNSKSNTGITLSEGRIHVATEGNSFWEITDTGTTISGDVNFQMNPANMKFGGLFAMPDFFRGSIPSTPVTPNPLFLPALPTEMIESLAEISAITASWMV